MLSDVLSENYQVPERILIDAMSVFDDEALEIAAQQAEQQCTVLNALRGNAEIRFSASQAS